MPKHRGKKDATYAANASSDAKEEDEEEEPFLTHTEKQRYDGWYNNLAHPDWGSIDSQLTRKAPPSYLDGVYQMAGAGRPGARALSQALMKGRDGLASRRNLTVLFTFFGKWGEATTSLKRSVNSVHPNLGGLFWYPRLGWETPPFR
ncbi:Dual oxidase [Araneus ventricosus]|uniref:Dual oxidase n=1 Tax=Araneus ventricosus TaxID=182803 RepID=A0A4Y2SSZ7_ARAVE|nr:Dual oxidase [Araneus ventricosus]